ncbi:hypothetical protein [Hymenobacter sp. DG01]|uniref:hypothetical protein n=1 Tax=Hymenobacter sp. DG01 TaxID=2584940 RepID=UPI0011208789|nr:hypothetical protein [Hymenobacter sp. DG01]
MSDWFITFCKSLDLLVYWAMIIPFAVAFRYRSSLTGGMRTLRWVPLFLFLMYCLLQISIKIWHYGLIINHINTVGETLLYIKVYHDEFNSKKTKRWIRILTVCFLIFAAVDSFWIEGFDSINSYTNLVESIIVISLGILFFEHIISKSNHQQIQKIPMFIATVGILLYLSGTVLLYLVTNNFIASNDEYSTRLMYLLNSILLLLLAIIFLRAFFLARKKTPAAPVYAG